MIFLSQVAGINMGPLEGGGSMTGHTTMHLSAWCRVQVDGCNTGPLEGGVVWIDHGRRRGVQPDMRCFFPSFPTISYFRQAEYQSSTRLHVGGQVACSLEMISSFN